MEFRKFARITGGCAEAGIPRAVSLALFDRLDSPGRPVAAMPVATGTDPCATTLPLNTLVTPT